MLGKIERENLLDDNNYSETEMPPPNASKKRVYPFAELLGPPSSNSEFRSPPSFAYDIKSLLLGAINFYQAVITKQDGSSCKASPTCSEWGFEKVKRHSIWGVVLIANRLLRCYRCPETGCEL
ncbi:MAG: membrane protein insertion efficiency factor YidD [Candidatus Poribacteria bacterium]